MTETVGTGIYKINWLAFVCAARAHSLIWIKLIRGRVAVDKGGK